jgi:hypothetical protein
MLFLCYTLSTVFRFMFPAHLLSRVFYFIYKPKKRDKKPVVVMTIGFYCFESVLPSASIQFWDHFSISFISGSRAKPFSVREYSIRTGVSGYTSRLTMPCVSRSFKRSDSTRPLIPIDDSKVQNLFGPVSSW